MNGMLNRLFKKKKVAFSDNSFADLDQDENEIINLVSPYTMTSKERLVSLIRAIRYIGKNNIVGDFVECGVWKGGSIMAMILALKKINSLDRRIWICDTFQGMTSPISDDSKFDGTPAKDLLEKDKERISNVWAVSGLEEVKSNIESLKYPDYLLEYVVGPVEQTLPDLNIQKISLLRLDTDWYESTKVEMELLFPRLVKGGILIIDDYGHWQGCKKAVDEYLDSLNRPYFLNRIDYTGRLLVKDWE